MSQVDRLTDGRASVTRGGRTLGDDVIQTAVVAACRLLREEPQAVFNGLSSRARHVAYASLRDAFPEASPGAIASAIGFAKPTHARSQLNQARTLSWWREEYVDEVVGELVSGQYGAQAL